MLHGYVSMKKYAWEEVYRRKGYTLKTPDPLVMEFSKKEGEKRTNPFILDLGCGGGRHISALSKPGATVIGLDISFIALKHSKNLASSHRAYLIRADMEFMPFCDNSLDIILAWRVLHMGTRRKLENTFKEIERTLKSGGKLFASIRSRKNILYTWGKNNEEEFEDGTLKIHHIYEIKGAVYHFFHKEELLTLLSNFEIIKLEEISLEHTSYTKKLGGENWFFIVEAVKR